MTALKRDIRIPGSPQSLAHNSWLTPFDDLQKEMKTLFERFFERDMIPLNKDAFRFPAKMKAFNHLPSIEISEKKDKYEITAELPGVEEKDVSVEVHDGVLTMKGEKRIEEDREEKDVHISERSYGSFERSFVMPDDADEEAIDANVVKGVLKVTIGKSADSKSSARKIEVKGS